jgi:hypothetical protein
MSSYVRNIQSNWTWSGSGPKRFHILTVASIKMIVLLDSAQYSLVENDLRFGGANCLHRQSEEASQ